MEQAECQREIEVVLVITQRGGRVPAATRAAPRTHLGDRCGLPFGFTALWERWGQAGNGRTVVPEATSFIGGCRTRRAILTEDGECCPSPGVAQSTGFWGKHTKQVNKKQPLFLKNQTTCLPCIFWKIVHSLCLKPGSDAHQRRILGWQTGRHEMLGRLHTRPLCTLAYRN